MTSKNPKPVTSSSSTTGFAKSSIPETNEQVAEKYAKLARESADNYGFDAAQSYALVSIAYSLKPSCVAAEEVISSELRYTDTFRHPLDMD